LDLFDDDLFEYMKASAWGDSPAPSLPATELQLETLSPPENTYSEDSEQIQNLDETHSQTESIASTQENGLVTISIDISTHAEEAPDDGLATVPAIEYQEENALPTQELKTFLLTEEKNKIAKHETAKQLDGRGYREAIGIIEDIDFKKNKQVVNAVYNPKEYFQGCFQAAWKAGMSHHQPLLLKSRFCAISLFPRTNEIWLKTGDNELSCFANLKLKHKNISAEIALIPINPQKLDFKNALDKFQSSEAFLWKLACWTSKGRYPNELDFTQPVILKSWPNFTRLLITPHAFRISSLLIRGPRTMDNIAKSLDIDIQYVFVFISAAYAIGLAVQAKRLSDNLVEPSHVNPTKKQGLLSRIMSKLRK
jgi:hypothetical protein